MHVSRIKISNFMNHRSTEVAIPRDGLVVIRGANGSGKSSLFEAVAWSMYGKTIRGTSPLPPGGETTAATVTLFGGDDVTRSRRKNKETVAWKRAHDAGVEYETRTKADAAIADHYGSMDDWLRTHVFAATSFSSATDAERKRLLESLLGLEHFQVAYGDAREHARAVARELADAVTVNDRCSREVEHLDELLADAEKTLDAMAGVAEVDDLSVRVEKSANELDEAAAAERRLRREASKTDAASLAAAQEVRRAEEQIRNHSDVCSACGSPLADAAAHMELLQGRLHEARAAAKEAAELAARAENAANDAFAAYDKVRQRSAADIARLHELRSMKEAYDSAKQRIGELDERLDKAEAKLDTSARHLTAAEKKAAIADAAVAVLGPTGFRAKVVGEALSAMEGIANDVLTRLGGGVRVALSATTETKGGKVRDTIGMTATTTTLEDGDIGALSAGERRRVDVALVMSLSRLAGGEGTLWFDEVFDGLDGDGADQLVDVLGQWAEDQAVVVVTHRDDIASRITGATRIDVENGEVTISR